MIDLLIRQSYYAQHLAPIWNALPERVRGKIYAPAECELELQRYVSPDKLVPYTDGMQFESEFVLTASYGDAVWASRANPSRKVILTEHGVGLTFGLAAYADGLGQRGLASLFLVPSQYVADKAHPDLKDRPREVIGVPKLDPWKGEFEKQREMPEKPTVAIAFHHGDRNANPGVVGSAWEHYAGVLPELAKRYKLLLHAHPLLRPDHPLMKLYKTLGAEFVPDFADIMNFADLYINDASSTAYEFLVTGKPVILLNAPWFDKTKNYGIRFWDYSDVGEQVDEPQDLIPAIQRTIENPGRFLRNRTQAVRDLFPYLGDAAQRAADVLTDYMEKNQIVTRSPRPAVPAGAMPQLKPHKPIRTGTERGIVYMCFGEKAVGEMRKSIVSLRNAGCTLPVFVVGNCSMDGLSEEIRGIHLWDGQSPYDTSKASNFQFRAGRVKPFLYRLSPFDETLYVDVDTEFMTDPEAIFGFLKRWEFCIAQERLSVAELYNQRGAGWEHDINERDVTIQEFGGSGWFPFWNSGVFAFRKCDAVEEMFDLWLEEWERFGCWDEQKALMRAGNRSSVRIFVLSEQWNHPHKNETVQKIEGAKLIYHAYGRGVARSDG